MIIYLCLSFNTFAQSFEGKIIYKINYKSKVANYPSENLNRLMGTKQIYMIKDNNYKSIFNGFFIKMQLYRGDENKGYTLTVKSDTLYREDYSINKDKALSYEIKKNQDTIMGIPCDVIIIQAEKSKTYFYYNSNYSVNPNDFKQHKYGNWYYIISKTKALPLKTVYENAQYIATSIATEIKPERLNDEIFIIPNNVTILPAYW